MKYTTRQVGQIGEIAAARYLRKQGYDIVSANYYTYVGEIDLIAFKDDVLVFCEVKTRSTNKYGRPSEYVTRSKQEKLMKSALQFVHRYKLSYKMRMDIIEVMIPSGLDMYAATINHIKNAFNGDGLSASVRSSL